MTLEIDKALIAEALDALESDATVEQRRDAFDKLRDRWFPLRSAQQETAEPGCVCRIDDGLVQEWVSKARAVAKSKGYDVTSPRPSEALSHAVPPLRGPVTAIACPHCGAEPGNPCRSPEGAPSKLHGVRYAAARTNANDSASQPSPLLSMRLKQDSRC